MSRVDTSPEKKERVRHCDFSHTPRATRVNRFHVHVKGYPLCIDEILKGSLIFRGSKDYAVQDEGIWSIQRHPTTDFGSKPAYFAREADAAGEYGCIAVFEATRDIYTLALDNDSTLFWVHKQAERHPEVLKALKESFPLDGERNSVYKNDFTVAGFICDLKLNIGDMRIEGYSSAKTGRFSGIHAEFALCSSSLRSLTFRCLDTSTCEGLQSKMLGKDMEAKHGAEKASRRFHSEELSGVAKSLMF